MKDRRFVTMSEYRTLEAEKERANQETQRFKEKLQEARREMHEFEGAQGAKFDQMKRRMEEQVQVERRK